MALMLNSVADGMTVSDMLLFRCFGEVMNFRGMLSFRRFNGDLFGMVNFRCTLRISDAVKS